MLLFLLVGCLHVFIAPYTKVEESFNLHATHDIIFHGFWPSTLSNVRTLPYDHFVFPGVVPRSFIGSLALSSVAGGMAVLAKALSLVHSKYDIQVLVRLTLVTVNALGLTQLRHAVTRQYGPKVSTMFVLLTCSQFHIPFWMGRTLPNMFAFYPVNFAFTFMVAKCTTPEDKRTNFNTAIAILTFTAVTLRSELVLLLGPIVLQALYLRHTDVLSVIKTGLVTGILSLALTVSVDSYFWDKWPLWPEFAGLYFNVYEGKSSEWGTSPPYSYFAVHLPKLLLSTLPLSVLGIMADARMRALIVPCIAFVALLSCLGHKEWRFVVYVVPVWNIAGARGAAWLLSTRIRANNAIISHGLKLILLGLFGFNIAATALLTQASMLNYPGGEALDRLNNILERPEFPHGNNVSVHIGNYAAQTGASLFLHEHTSPHGYLAAPRGSFNVIYNKTENLVAPDDFRHFDWVITEYVDKFTSPPTNGAPRLRWRIQSSIDGLRRVQLKPLGEHGVWKKLRVPHVVEEPRLWLLQRQYD